MKHTKGVLSALTALLLAGSNLWALNIDLSNVKLDGMLDIKAQSATNEEDQSDLAQDTRNSTRHKLVLGLGGQLTDGVMARMEAVRRPLTSNGFLGTANASTAGQYGQGAQSAQNELDNWLFQEASLSLDNLIWDVNAKLGRMGAGDDDSLTMYAGHYDDDDFFVRTVDAVNLQRKFGDVINVNYLHATPVDVKALAGTDYPAAAVSAATGRQVVRSLGLGLNLKDVSGNDMLDIPVMVKWHHGTAQGDDSGAANDNVNLGIYELNVGANLMENSLMLGLDWASNNGQRNLTAGTPAMVKFKGSLMALKAKYNNEDVGFSVWANMVTASGDDDNGDPSATVGSVDDKSWHDMTTYGMTPRKSYGEILGKSTILTDAATGVPITQGANTGSAFTANGHGRGLSITNIGAGYTLPAMDKSLKITADYIMAEYAKIRGTPATGTAGGAADVTTLKKDIGTEIDLALHYKKSDNVGFKIGYAQFSPEANSLAFTAVALNPVLDDGATKYFANATIKF